VVGSLLPCIALCILCTGSKCVGWSAAAGGNSPHNILCTLGLGLGWAGSCVVADTVPLLTNASDLHFVSAARGLPHSGDAALRVLPAEMKYGERDCSILDQGPHKTDDLGWKEHDPQYLWTNWG